MSKKKIWSIDDQWCVVDGPGRWDQRERRATLLELFLLQRHWVNMQNAWYERARVKNTQDGKPSSYAHDGSCVLGAAIEFVYHGKNYSMPPYSYFQGSLPWESTKDVIEESLARIGAKNIHYNPGRMD